jgi:hypothetical protein
MLTATEHVIGGRHWDASYPFYGVPTRRLGLTFSELRQSINSGRVIVTIFESFWHKLLIVLWNGQRRAWRSKRSRFKCLPLTEPDTDHTETITEYEITARNLPTTEMGDDIPDVLVVIDPRETLGKGDPRNFKDQDISA